MNLRELHEFDRARCREHGFHFPAVICGNSPPNENFEILRFSNEKDLPAIIYDRNNEKISYFEPIISLKKMFLSSLEDNIKEFNQINLNDLFDYFARREDNTPLPYRLDLDQYLPENSISTRTPTTGHVERISANELYSIHQTYQQKMRQIANKIIEMAKLAGLSEEIDINLLCEVIEFHQVKRENPKMEFFVNLCVEGNAALQTHLNNLKLYSPFTPQQTQSIFLASAQQKLPRSVKKFFGDSDRVYFRFKSHDYNPTEDSVTQELEKLGYKIVSYEDGHAVKIADNARKQVFKIGKILKDNPALLGQFSNDPQRQIRQFMLVISRNPIDIARMSTDRAWISCMSSGGMSGVNNFHYVPNEIRHGALVAYVVRVSDPEIHDPLSRILLKPYVRDEDLILDKNNSFVMNRPTIYVPGQTYGLPNQAFVDAMQDVANQLNEGQMDGDYYMPFECYDDGMPRKAELISGVVHQDMYMLNELNHFIQNRYNEINAFRLAI